MIQCVSNHTTHTAISLWETFIFFIVIYGIKISVPYVVEFIFLRNLIWKKATDGLPPTVHTLLLILPKYLDTPNNSVSHAAIFDFELVIGPCHVSFYYSI